MAELKTKQHDGDVFDFIDSYVDTEQNARTAWNS